MNIRHITLAASFAVLLSACGGDSAVTEMPPPAANTVCTGTEATSSRLFLQQLSDTSVIVKWRGDATAACIGTSASNLTTRVVATTTAGDHKEAKFSGLTPDSAYFYSVGGAPIAPAAQTFRTAPTTGYPSNDGNTRIWVVGDSGTAGYLHSDTSATVATPTAYPGVADAVRQGMSSFTKTSGQAIDMLLMLGDNAYNNGDDANYQAAVFDTYKAELKNVALWPTIGNHEMGANHDSDSTSITLSIDKPQIDMRNEFVPVFQKYGVDVVLNGHSHSYERSYYMKDLYAGTPGVVNGDSKEFVAATHAYGKGYSGRSAAGEEYKKTPGYVVYSAAGNGGKADHDYGSMGVVTEWLNHAAHVLQPFWNWVGAQVAGSSKSGADHKRGLAIPGSVLIDANKDRLEVQMLNQTGQVLDQFLISKK